MILRILCRLGWHLWEDGFEIGGIRHCAKCDQWLMVSDSTLIFLCEVLRSWMTWFLIGVAVFVACVDRETGKAGIAVIGCASLALLPWWFRSRRKILKEDREKP